MLREDEVTMYDSLTDDHWHGTDNSYFSGYCHEDFDLDNEGDREMVGLFKKAADYGGRLGCYIISGLDGNFEPVVVIDSKNTGHYWLRFTDDREGIVISPQFYYESLPIAERMV